METKSDIINIFTLIHWLTIAESIEERRTQKELLESANNWLLTQTHTLEKCTIEQGNNDDSVEYSYWISSDISATQSDDDLAKCTNERQQEHSKCNHRKENDGSLRSEPKTKMCESRKPSNGHVMLCHYVEWMNFVVDFLWKFFSFACRSLFLSCSPSLLPLSFRHCWFRSHYLFHVFTTNNFTPVN